MKAADRREAALKRGADELMSLAEHGLRDDRRALLRLRRSYVKFCLDVYGAIERRWKKVP